MCRAIALLLSIVSVMELSLSGKIEGVFKYIAQAVEPDGSNREQILEKQSSHLSSLIQRQASSGLDISDATKALQLFKSDQCPFTPDQSKQLRSLIDSVGAPSADGNGSGDAWRNYTKCQEHVYIHNYMTEKKWELLLTDDIDIDSIIDIVADTCAETGCLYPSPKPSQQWMVAFIHAVHGSKFSEDDAFETLGKLRNKLHRLRKNKHAGAPTGIKKYTELGKLFAETYPAAFPPEMKVLTRCL